MSAPGRRGGILGRLGAAAAAMAAAAVILATAAPASAHDYLVSSTPKAGSTVTGELTTVSLVFDDVVLDDNGHGALAQVTDAAGRNYETDCVTVDGRDVSVPVALGAHGTYRVTWQVVSADGHPVSDSIQFDYTGPVAGQGHDGPLSTCGTTVKAPAASSASGTSTTAGISGSALTVLIVAAAIVVVAIGVVIVLLINSRRRRPRA